MRGLKRGVAVAGCAAALAAYRLVLGAQDSTAARREALPGQPSAIADQPAAFADQPAAFAGQGVPTGAQSSGGAEHPTGAATPPAILASQASPATRPSGGLFQASSGAAPAPAEAPPLPPPPGAASVSVPAATHPAAQISLNFKDAPVDTVLDYLSEVAGFVVLKESPVDGRVTVLSKQPVSPEEAVSLLNSVLKVNGYAAIQTGRILKITTREKAKKGSIPVQFGSDPALVVPSDELITQVIPVRSVDAVKLKQDLQPLVSNEADLTSNAASNTIMLTDTAANVRRVVQIVSNLDKRDAQENTIKVRQLKYADATAAAKLVADIFKTEDQSNQGGGGPPQLQFFRAMQRAQQGGGAEQEDKGRTGRVVASADERTNTVVVSGPTDTLKVIDTVLTQLDSDPSSQQTFFIYAVKNGQSQDMANTLNSLFGNGSGTSTSNYRSTTSSGSSNGLSNNRTAYGSSGGSGFGGGGGGGFGGGGTGGGGFGASSTGGALGGSTPIQRGSPATGGGGANVPAGVASAASMFAGQAYVVADVDTNSLLVAAATKHEARIRDIIEKLDRPVAQVLIKVLVAEVTHENSSDLGVDYSILNLRASGSGQQLAQDFGTAAAQAASGGFAVSIIESNLKATIRALANENKLDVLSRPYILASDNQLATITVGQEVPFITDSQTTALGQTVNSIQYRNIGIILNVTPHINPDGLVVLDVSPEISQLTGTTVPISSNVSAPVFDNRSADTRVAIKDGQTIVIGGLMQDQKSVVVEKVPLLGDIPIIGQLFRRDRVDKTKRELLIFLTPHVALAPDKLQGMSRDEMKGTQLTPNAVSPGTFHEHIRNLQRGGERSGAGTEPSIPFDLPDPKTAPQSQEPAP